VVLQNRIANYPDTGRFPEAELVAINLQQDFTSNDRFHANPPTDWPIKYYFWYHDVPLFETDDDGKIRKYFIAVQKSQEDIEDITDLPVTVVLEHGELILYRVETD